MYDTKCLEVAEHFLSDENLTDEQAARARRDLAQEIQTCIEGWIEFELPRLKGPSHG